MSKAGSIKRFIAILVVLVVLAVSTIILFNLLIAAPIEQSAFGSHSILIALIIGFGVVILAFIRRAKPLLTDQVGSQAAIIIQFFLGAIATLIMIFAILHEIGVSPENLLTGAGIVTITIGLIVSTFVGGILAGALVFVTHQFRVGDTVLINNIPGNVKDITLFATRIWTDVGQIVVSNSAIVSGAVSITKVHKELVSPSRIPFKVGDRIFTSYQNSEGVVKKLTPLYTVILTDSRKELTFLTNSILSGSTIIAKIAEESE